VPLFVHDRTVSLRIAGGVARGRVRSPDGYDECRSHVVVKILRDGDVVKRLETNGRGRFRTKLGDAGRYLAVAPQVVVGDTDMCARARSKSRRA
jgi:hypothetical protein